MTRGLLMMSATLAVVAGGAFWVGVAGGRQVRDEFFYRGPEFPPIETGRQMPNAVAHLETGQTVRFSELWEGEELLVLIIFTPGCASCFAESKEWQAVADDYPVVKVAAIATTPQPGFLEELRRQSDLTFELFRAPDPLRRQLSAGASPTIYAVDWDGRVLFGASGVPATTELRNWIEENVERLRAGYVKSDAVEDTTTRE